MIWQNTTNQTVLIVEMNVKSKEKNIHMESKSIWKSKRKKDPFTFFSEYLVYSLLSKT